MIMRKRTIALYPFLLCGISFILFAEEREAPDTAKTVPDTIASLDKVVVTATRTSRLMSETPASVSVITEAEIDVAPAKNIDDMLRYETGVQLKRVVGMGEGIPADIILRGIPGALSATRTLILVDGIPTNASGAPFLILNEVPMDAIKSVEIVRGPYSSLYGANAFSGVVNILTKKGYGRPSVSAVLEGAYPFTVLNKYFANDKSMGTSIRESFGDTYWNVSSTVSGGTDKAHYLVSGGYRTIGDYLLRDSAITKHDSTLIYKKNSNYDYRDLRFFGKCGVALNEKVELEVHGRFFDSELGFGKTKNIIPDSADIVTKGMKIVVGPMAKFNFTDNINVVVKSYYRTLIGEFENEEPLTDTDYVRGYWKSQSHDWDVETQGLFKFGSHHIFTAGAEYLGNFIHFGEKVNPENDSLIPGTYAADEGIQNFALYIQDEITLFNRLNIVPGFRWDYHSDFGSAISPKLGLSYKIIEWLRFRSSVGRGFRAPTLSELYMPDLTIRPEFVLNPNPDLKPEYIWAMDGAFEITPIPTLKAQIGLFYNNMKDLIGQNLELSTANVTHENITKAWARGIEVELDWNTLKWLNLNMNYVFQNTRNVSAGETRKIFDNTGRKQYSHDDFEVSLDYIPEHALNFGIVVKKEIKSFIVEGVINELYKSRRTYLEWTEIDRVKDVYFELTDTKINVYIDPPLIPLKPYWLTDMGLKCTYKKHIWFALNIQNLFNIEYEESGGTLATGRFASIKIGTEF